MEALSDVRNIVTMRILNKMVAILPGKNTLRYISVGHMTLSKKKLHSTTVIRLFDLSRQLVWKARDGTTTHLNAPRKPMKAVKFGRQIPRPVAMRT